MNFLTAIFLIHGLGGTNTSLQPLKAYLEYQGYTNVHLIEYKSRQQSLENSIIEVNEQMNRIIGNNSHNPEIVLIGQSLGGLICHNMHLFGWNIVKSITIGSPHHGSALLNLVEKWVPEKIANYLRKPVYKDLYKQQALLPSHPYYTISTSFVPYFDFDGQVWITETMIDDEKHTHIPFNNHWTILLDPRLFLEVVRILN